jgi:hypothetical protein
MPLTTLRQCYHAFLHLHLSHLADALIQSDLQIGVFTFSQTQTQGVCSVLISLKLQLNGLHCSGQDVYTLDKYTEALN